MYTRSSYAFSSKGRYQYQNALKTCNRIIASTSGSYHNYYSLKSPLPASLHTSKSMSFPSPFLKQIRGGHSEHFVSTSASSEADSSSTYDDESSELMIQMQSLADECEKQGICNGLEKSTFGGLDYTSTTSLNASRKHRVIFVLGGPGAGKGTQCENILKHYNSIHHFSVGELLRNVPKNSPYAELIDQCLVAGKIVPVDISLSLLRDAMDNAVTTASSDNDASTSNAPPIFLVDGFPRNFDNLSGWINTMPEYAAVLGALVFDCPIEELEKRILDRGKTSGRSDDNLSSARKRFQTFQEQTAPVVQTLEILQHERGQALKVVHIAGEKTREEVWSETCDAMNDFFMGDVLSANAKLLNAVENKDLAGYLSLCNIKMLADDDDLKMENGEDMSMDQLSQAFQSLEAVNDVGNSKQISKISNAKIQFFDGASSTVSYDRVISLENEEVLTKLHETRVWNQGGKGWKNVHFIRGPV